MSNTNLFNLDNLELCARSIRGQTGSDRKWIQYDSVANQCRG